MGHGEGSVAQDPRAPRTAAASTLLAGVLLVLGAVNMTTDLIGASGPSTEEFAAFGAAMFLLIVSRVASSEREIPELTTPQLNQGGAEYLETQTSVSQHREQDVNPTTASILTSILGSAPSVRVSEVDEAISSLMPSDASEPMAPHVAAAEPEPAVVLDDSTNQSTQPNDLLSITGATEPDAVLDYNPNQASQREALPANEQTGETLQRVIVQPVPLPGRENEAMVDPTTIPGLEPNRTFVREGVAHVPLPQHANKEPARETTPQAAPAPTPELPELGDLFEEAPSVVEPPAAPPLSPSTNQPSIEVPALPDLDDLFATIPNPEEPVKQIDLPVLPDLDDLF